MRRNKHTAENHDAAQVSTRQRTSFSASAQTLVIPTRVTTSTLPSFPFHISYPTSKMVASQMFLGTAAALIVSSTAFVAPVAVRSSAPASSASALKMSAGSDYVATLPGAPFSDGKVKHNQPSATKPYVCLICIEM